MATFHAPISFGDETDSILDLIEGHEPSNSFRLLAGLEAHSKTDSQTLSYLALSSAQWVDHSGPFIGHGVLNADPTLRSMELMGDGARGLPLFHLTMYITDLLRHPNYGPYQMMKIEGITKGTERETADELSKAMRSGNGRYMSEKLLEGLYSVSGKGIREQLLYEALMQYGNNEHKLLLPFHAFRLLDRGRSWENAVALLRPTVQYLSSYPDISHGVKAEQISKTIDLKVILDKGEEFNQDSSYDISRMVLNSALGNEMLVMSEYAKTASLPELYESIALSSTILLLNSDLEQHSVTGKHSLLSLLDEGRMTERTRVLALLLSMEGPRARRIKTYIPKSLDAFMKLPEVSVPEDEGEFLEMIESEIQRGQQEPVFRLAGSYVKQGYNVDNLARKLLSIAFRTEGPFESLHTSKMLVGMRDITLRSRSDMKWIHLAASAWFLAGMVKKEKEESKKTMEQYRKYLELSQKY